MHRPAQLETVFVTVPAIAVPAYEAALAEACVAVGMFIADEEAGTWRVEGVKLAGESPQLRAGLAMAEIASGYAAELQRQDTDAEGWLARVYEGFPEQLIGRRFSVRGTHVDDPLLPGRATLMLDAGLAFGSGEHGSTRGCLRALERVAHRRPRRVLDMGCGSGILAMGAAALLKTHVLAVDIDPWSVRVTRQNAQLNGLAPLIDCRLGNGWHAPAVQGRMFDLVFANILARPLCLMAKHLATHLAPGGTAILAGLLDTQVNAVLAAHRRVGLRLENTIVEGSWMTLILRPGALPRAFSWRKHNELC
jgi:ribosomal protein L11 methyltransferase